MNEDYITDDDHGETSSDINFPGDVLTDSVNATTTSSIGSTNAAINEVDPFWSEDYIREDDNF